MSGDVPLPQRRSIRLRDYDYAGSGVYAITICTLNRACLFGRVVDGEMRLNEAGEIARDEWLRSAEMRREIALDEFVVMPNHMHGIVFIESGAARNDGKPVLDTGERSPQGQAGGGGGSGRPPDAPTMRPASGSLGALVNGYKVAVTRALTVARIVSGASVWQRNYYEHVIRHEADLDRIRRYIRDNPAQWALDRENPDATPPA